MKNFIIIIVSTIIGIYNIVKLYVDEKKWFTI